MTDDSSRPTDPTASTPDWDAIARFLAGESPAEEASRIQAWLAEHPEERELVARLSSTTELSGAADVDVEAALSRVHARMATAPTVASLTVSRGGLWRRGYAIGVVSLLAAAAAFVLFVVRRPSDSPRPVFHAKANTFATPTGQRDSIELADGSRVILGPESRLTVPGNYGVVSRSVELVGDGYFDVRHDAAKPFSVRVANAVVEDLGTAFSIESDVRDTMTVAVMSGSVRLRAAGATEAAGTTLSAGDRGSLTATGTVRAFRHAVLPADSSWTHGVLEFHDASMRRVAGEIRRWFGVDLRIADSSLLRIPLTTTVRGNDPVDQVLSNIALSIGARVERQGNSATLRLSSRSPISR
jgi:transmembrane sensor